jgi:sigma-B regulation protein RsbU (phosphoserine phosphatase)
VYESSLPERFATMVFAVVDTTVSPVIIDLVVAGHPEPVVWGPDGLRLVSPTGPVVGLFPEGEWRDERVVLSAGHTLVLFTDGLTEARSADGAFFPRLIESVLSTAKPTAAQAVVSALVTGLDEIAGSEPRDDLAILAISPS